MARQLLLVNISEISLFCCCKPPAIGIVLSFLVSLSLSGIWVTPHLLFFPWSSCPQAPQATWINLALLRAFSWLCSMTVDGLAAPQRKLWPGFPPLEVSFGSGVCYATCIIGHDSLQATVCTLRINQFVLLEAEILHSSFASFGSPSLRFPLP